MSSTQVICKRKKKFTGGNASKRHRDRVNIEFNNLAKLLPFPENVIAKLDKSSILRLAVSYIRAKSFFKDALPLDDDKSDGGSKSPRTDDMIYKGILEETCLTEFFLQALDGFLIVITEDLKVLYVSDSVRDYLGYCQAGIIHESFLQFAHWADQENITNALKFTNDKNENSKDEMQDQQQKAMHGGINGTKPCESDCNRQNGYTDSMSYNRVESRRFICRMKCAFSCSSRFYTAFRAFQFSGHVRRSTIQEGKERRTLNTLIAFGTQCNNSKFDPLDLVSDVFDESRLSSCADDIDQDGSHSKMIGLHIEPRLRPHIAPIPIPQVEAEGRLPGQQQYLCNRRYSVGMRTDSSFGNQFNHAAPTNSAFRMFNDYCQDNTRYSGWCARSSSLSNSPISDASSPRGVKRTSSLDMSPENVDLQSNGKHLKLGEGYHRKAQIGPSGLQLDDIHTSARILMQLKATRNRFDCNRYNKKDYESDCSSDDRSDNSHDYDNAPEPKIFIERASYSLTNDHNDDRNRKETNFVSKQLERSSEIHTYLPNGDFVSERNGDSQRRTDSSREVTQDCIPRVSSCNRDAVSINGVISEAHAALSGYYKCPENVSPQRSLPDQCSSPGVTSPTANQSRFSFSSLSPARISPLRLSPTRMSPPKKESNRGFHISTILGLDDKSEREAVGSSHQPQGKDNHKATERKHNNDYQSNENCYAATQNLSNNNNHIRSPHSSNDASNLDDIKTSFAHILQGLTATITKSIDKSIDTFFKPSSGN